MRFPALLKTVDFWLQVLTVILLAGYVIQRGQDQNWDLLNYHFYSGYALLHGRTSVLDIAPAGIQSFLHPAINVLSYLAFTTLRFPYSALALFVLQVTSVPALVLISRELSSAMGVPSKSPARYAALILCLLSPLWVSELGTSFFSSTTGTLILWGLFLLLRDNQRHASIAWTFAGVLFGLAFGLKLTNGPFLVAAFFSALYITARCGRGMRLLLFSLGGLCGFALTGWWYWDLWTSWGSPAFPFFNTLFKSKYYSLTNFRDMRWVFGSLKDFCLFLVQAAFVTAKTAEIPFADARFLGLPLLLPGLILCARTKTFRPSVFATLLFFSISLALWAMTLAYQRYVIPIELLFGLVLWICIVCIAKTDRLVVTVMCTATICTAVMMKIPDWSHLRHQSRTNGPFQINIPKNISSTPANYLLIGKPLTYLLPSLHPASHFYGLGFSGELDKLIDRKVYETNELPLRLVVADHAKVNAVRKALSELSIGKQLENLTCQDYWGPSGRYVLCEVLAEDQKRPPTGLQAEATYAAIQASHSMGILYQKGLERYEPRGRWAGDASIEWGLDQCLPQGGITVEIAGLAFGPTIDVPLEMSVGSANTTFSFSGQNKHVTLPFMNTQPCARTVQVHVPMGTPPSQREKNAAVKTRGLAITGLRILAQ